MALKTAKNSPSQPDDEMLLYQDLVETSQDLIWQCDTEGRYVYLNPAWETTFGYKTEEMLGKKFSDFQTPEMAERDGKEFKRLMQGNMVKGLETVHISKAGTEIYLVFNAKTVVDKNGIVQGTRGTAHDITSRKQAEYDLIQTSAKFRSLFDQSPVGTAIVDFSKHFVQCNPAFCRFIGYSEDELIGKTVQDISFSEDRDIGMADLIRIKQGEIATASFRKRYIRKDKEIVWGEVSISLIKDSENKPLYFLAVIKDITQSMKMEAELLESQYLLKKMESIGNIGAWVVDTQNNTLSWTEGVYAIHEVGTEYLPDLESGIDFYTPESRPIIQKAVNQAIENNIPFDEELQIISARGNLKSVHTIGIPDPEHSRIYGFFQDITRQKQVELDLQESQSRLELAAQSAKLGIWDWDIVNNILIWDEQMYELYGVKDNTALKNIDLWNNGLHPDDADYAWEECQAAMRGEKKYDVEFRVLHPDGQIRYIKADGLVLRDAAGEAIRMIGINRDITRDKEAEQKLLKSEEKYRLLYTAMEQGLALHEIILDDAGIPVDYIFLDINDSYTRLVGISKEMCIGKRVKEVFPQVEQYWIDVYGKVALTGESCYYENYMKTNNKYYSVYSYSPRKYQFAVLVTDITERKLAEKILAAEKERLAVTLRSIGDGVITTDIQGNIVIMNKVAEALCGWSQEEAQGRPITEVFNIINESTRKPHINPVEKVLNTGEIIELANHTLLISRDGTERAIADSGAPIKDKDSQTIGVVLVFRDMTEKQKFLEKTQNMQRLESLGVLAGGIAHDFNNLMGGVFGYIDMALEETKEKNVKAYLSESMAALERARALTSQLLTFAKGGAPHQKVTSLFPFVQDTARFALSGSNVTLDFDVQEDLWYANVDQGQIGQVIDNIIINAQQAMPNGGCIRVTARNITFDRAGSLVMIPGDYVHLSIQDQGIGIAPEIISHIFDPFYTTKSKGHGLGLATCYSIIKRHEGYIDVESQPGKGSNFNIYLPADHRTSEQKKSSAKVELTGSGTIIVMDDEDMICDLSSAMLKQFGYKVLCAKNGEEALAIFSRERSAGRLISGLLLDLTIPGAMGGKDTVREIRKVDPDIPVFVVSGYADDPIMKKPGDYGFTASICKPFRRSEIADMLRRYLIPSRSQD